VPVCAAIEAEIAQLDEADRADFLRELHLDEPGLNRVIRGGYALLGPADLFYGRRQRGAGLDRARGSTAPQAAGRHPHRLREAASSAPKSSPTRISSPARARPAPRKHGKMRLEGKEYIVREGDVMHFRFNV
jgi:ribosome-binding ATPase